MNETFFPRFRGRRAVIGELLDWLEAVMIAVVAAVIVFTFLARVISVVGDSMAPTLEDGEMLVISRVLYTPGQGDIVVVTKPNRLDEPLIKRVIAVGGQTVDIDFDEHTVTVDGVLLEEPYIAEATELSYDMDFPQTVPEGHIFVMGDNRNNSWDSRDSHIGMIDQRYVFGRVIFRLTPLDSMGVPS